MLILSESTIKLFILKNYSREYSLEYSCFMGKAFRFEFR